MTVNILGTAYTIIVKKYSDDPYFGKWNANGYRDGMLKEIVLCDLTTYPGFEDETIEYMAAVHQKTLRHEIVHAFLYESGLDAGSHRKDGPWANNEEMVDWIAIQGPKIYKAWQDANALGR